MFWTFVAVALTVVAYLYSKAYEETGVTFYLVFKWFYLVMALSAAVYIVYTIVTVLFWFWIFSG